jgi:hypothetical protein
MTLSSCPFDEFAPPLSEATLSARPLAALPRQELEAMKLDADAEVMAVIEREMEVRGGS